VSTTEVKKKMRSYPTKWDEAIADARQRIRGLKKTIEFFRQSKKKGESWPNPATQN